MKQSTSSRQQRRQQLQRPVVTHTTTTPASARMSLRRDRDAWQPTSLTRLMLAPLRLFLGVTFVYAGIQKLTDPQFFAPNAPGYIGRQITAFAAGSPVRAVLLNVALPHAALFGSLVAWGELAIGVGALLSLLLRPAAFFGALLSLLFFLSASWRVHPYFYGSDIVFLFAWLTLLLTGPAAGGWFALDGRLAAWLATHVPVESAHRFTRWAGILLGVQPPAVELLATRGRSQGQVGRGSRYAPATRRDFLRGALTGIATSLGAVLAVTLFSKGGSSALQPITAATPTATVGSGETVTTTATTTAPGAAAIATTSQTPINSAVSFTLPSNGDPGVLVHLADGNFVAFDATCTHAGCPVQYDPSSKLLLCPCHGAAFDPAHGAEVVQGPADTPLASVPVQVDNATGAITVSG